MEVLVHKISLTKFIKDYKTQLINECVDQRKFLENSGNFKLKTNLIDKLYHLFIICSEKCLNKFTLKDKNFEVWCCITDNKFNLADWHNHKDTATINGVIYLDTQGKGIDFRYEGREAHIKPQNDDILIFPGSVDHRLHPSKDEKRISLNLELRCNDSEKDLFNKGAI